MADSDSQSADQERNGRWLWRALWLLLILMILYPLNFGPLLWLAAHGYMGNETFTSINNCFYKPLYLLGHQFEPVGKFLNWYVPLWGK